MARTPREAIWFPIDTGIKENAERAAQIMSQTQNKKVCQWHAVDTALVAFITNAWKDQFMKTGTKDDGTTKKERTVLASVVDDT